MPDAARRLVWEAPGDGVWWLARTHFPRPVSRLFATLFPPVTTGWLRGAERLGLPIREPRWAAVNAWLYVSPGPDDPATHPALEEAARRTLAERAWRAEADRWFEIERPVVIESNHALQSEELSALEDAALAEHLDSVIDHFLAVAPLRFEHVGVEVAGGLLLLDAERWGLQGAEVTRLLTAPAPARSPSPRVDRIARALEADGVKPGDLADLAQVRLANRVAAVELDRYLSEHGCRLIHGHDLTEPTLAERPDLVLASIRARLGTGPAEHGSRPPPVVRSRVPVHARGRFDELLADARLLRQVCEDAIGVCFTWPLGLVRRAVLETAGRLRGRGLLDDAEHLFEAEPDELAVLARSTPASPRDEALIAALADRAALRAVAAGVDPPDRLGEAPPGHAPAPWPHHVSVLASARDAYSRAAAIAAAEPLAGIGIGDRAVRGRAFVAEAEVGTLEGIEPGDVLVTVTTTAAYNAIFPVVSAVVTETGGLFSHAAILARELGIPAVVGVPGALGAIGHGDVIEVDPVAGVVRIVERRRRAR